MFWGCLASRKEWERAWGLQQAFGLGVGQKEWVEALNPKLQNCRLVFGVKGSLASTIFCFMSPRPAHDQLL